jgi:hypothetical protein
MKSLARGRCRGGALLKLIVFLLIFGGIVTAAWIYFLPALLTSTLEKRTGFTVKVSKMSINPFQGLADFEGLVVTNPHTFPRSDFLDITLFRADAEVKTLFSDRPVINHAIIEVAKVGLVRNSDGTLNARLFNERLFPKPKSADSDKGKTPAPKPGQPSTPPKPKEQPAPEPPPMQFLIKRLDVRFANLLIEDHSGRKVTSREYPVRFAQTYENVTDAKQLVSTVAMRSFSSVGAAISGLIPGDFGRAIDAATKSGSDILKDGNKKSGDTLKTFVDTLEETRKP